MFKLKFISQIIPVILLALIAIFLGVYKYKALTQVNNIQKNPETFVNSPSLPIGKTQGEIVAEARLNLVEKSSSVDTDISTVSIESVNWPDTSLGCPKPGEVYAQIITPGYRIVLKINDKTYTYHSSSTNIKLCQPTE